MVEVTPINEAQGLWRQHKEIKERIGDLALRVHTISYYLMAEFRHDKHMLNDSQDGIILLEVVEEACKEMKVLIERMDEVRNDIDKVEGRKSLWEKP